MARKSLLHKGKNFEESMKVCFISHSSRKGGAESSLLELVDILKEKGVECYLILPGHGPLINELKNRKMVYRTFPYKWWMGKNSPLWECIKRTVLNLAITIPIAIRIKQWRCDVVYTNTITVCVGALAAKLLRLPHVWHIHEYGYEDHGLVYDIGQRLSLWMMERLSSVCIANSNAVAKKYRQFIPERKVKMVYYAVNVTMDQCSSDFVDLRKQAADIRSVIVGRLQEGKRQEDAIQAIGELVRKGLKAKLYIVGDGAPKYEQYLYTLVAQDGTKNYITFLGYVDNPLLVIQQADLLLMCSRCEAFGRVTVEAMRAGKPVIGAKSGGTIELIQDGFNGLLYTPGDYRELAQKILYLHEHPELAEQMGKNGQRWAAEQFTEERYGKEVLAILRRLVNR